MPNSRKFIISRYNKDDLIVKFVIVKRITNFDILKCYKLLFSKSALINNIGSYLILIVIFLYIIFGIYFYMKESHLIYGQINNILNKINLDIYNKSNIFKITLKKDSLAEMISKKRNNNKYQKDNLNKSNNKIDYSDHQIKENNLNFKNMNKIDNKEIMKYKFYFENEINHASYEEALEKDKRTY